MDLAYLKNISPKHERIPSSQHPMEQSKTEQIQKKNLNNSLHPIRLLQNKTGFQQQQQQHL